LARGRKGWSRETTHTYIGALIIVVAVAFTGFINVDDPSDAATNSYRVAARFVSTDGITIGSDVLMAGIPVGKVVSQHYLSDEQLVLVNMAVQRDIEIPEDSVAMIVSDGVFGSKYIKLSAGGSFDPLGPGDEFEYVQDSVIFEELLQKVILGAEAKRLRARGEDESSEETN